MSVSGGDALWSWSQSRSSAGSFEPVQRITLPAPVVHDESLRELVPLRLTPFDAAARAAIAARER
jgi:hypothetical protein